MAGLRVGDAPCATLESLFMSDSIFLGDCSYPSHLRPVDVHFRHVGFASSHFMWRILVPQSERGRIEGVVPILASFTSGSDLRLVCSRVLSPSITHSGPFDCTVRI